MGRPSGRDVDELRRVSFTRRHARHAEGSVLIECGDTQVLCTASVEETVPAFLRGKSQGWITAEYGMLPRSTHTRTAREAARGRQSGRTQEIQRLIGRSLRAVADLKALGERTVTIDCDVLQADGGTRTASITGGFVALAEACEQLVRRGLIAGNPLHGQVAAVSVGIVGGVPVLDLDYAEDSQAETDMNVVMNNGGAFVEIQGTAEGHAFRRHELDALLNLAAHGIGRPLTVQAQTLERPGVESARYAHPGASDTENLERLLDELAAVPPPKRRARYQCVIVLVRGADDPQPLIARGSWEGRIATSPRGLGGFGYDPVFVPEGSARTAAELDPAEKNAVSHRGQALRELIAMLGQQGYIAAP